MAATPRFSSPARHDQALDLRRAFPDAVDAQLAPQPLGGVRPHVAAAAQHLHHGVGDATCRFGGGELGHRGLAVHELGVGAGVEELRDVAREQLHGQAGTGSVGEWERNALEVHDALAELLALERPLRADLEQALHRAHAARRDVDAFLDEPLVRERVAGADRAEALAVWQRDALEPHRWVADGEGVRERRVVDDRDARPLVDEEQRRPESAPVLVDREHVDDEEVGHVPARREPLLGVHHPALAAAARRAANAPGIRAGLGLGDRVALAALPAQRRAEVALDLVGRPVREHVGDAGDVPPDTVRVAPERLVHDDLLEQSHALAAVLGSVVDADQAGLLRSAHDCARRLRRELAPAALGRLLVRQAVLVDEAPRPRGELDQIALAHVVRSAASSANTSMKRSMSASSCCTESVHSSSRPGVMKTPRFML
jgi:hypothetical protein